MHEVIFFVTGNMKTKSCDFPKFNLTAYHQLWLNKARNELHE